MTYNSMRKELVEMQLGEVVAQMNASAEPVVTEYDNSEGKKIQVSIAPQNVGQLSLVLMSNVAWENLGLQVKDHVAVGLFFECEGLLHCAIMDGELVKIQKPCFPFRSEIERIETRSFLHGTPSWMSVKNSQSLVLTIILNCLAKYALEHLVQRLFLPWGSVPLQDVVKK